MIYSSNFKIFGLNYTFRWLSNDLKIICQSYKLIRSYHEHTDALTLVGLQVTQFAIQSGRTPLTGVTPALAHGGAAQLSRANYPLKTRQALAVFYFGETGSGPTKCT